jgi:DNA invertase Pin-like site-specific DNA recombinase
MIAVYVRVSTSKQETAAQRKAIRDWCKLKGYDQAETVEFVDEGVSGKTLERPAFRRLMAEIRTGKVKRVVTFELSRFSRNFLDLLEVMRVITESGVVVEVPGEGRVQFDNTIEQFVVAAKGLVAAQERERISERTKAGLAAAKARGVKLGPKKGEQRKLGYRKDYREEDAAIVAKVLRLRARGETTHAIAAELVEDGKAISRSKVVRILARHQDR